MIDGISPCIVISVGIGGTMFIIEGIPGMLITILGIFILIEGILIPNPEKLILGISRHGNTICGVVKSVDILQSMQDIFGISGVSQIGISKIGVSGAVAGASPEALSVGVTTTAQSLLPTVTTGSGFVFGA